MALSAAKRAEIIDEVITNVEEIYFRRRVEDLADQLYQNGEVLDEARTNIQNFVTAYTPNPGALDLPSVRDNLVRSAGKLRFDDFDTVAIALQAIVSGLLDKFNNHASKINEILDAVDNAASFAAAKTNIAAIQDAAQQTFDQVKAAIKTRIDEL